MKKKFSLFFLSFVLLCLFSAATFMKDNLTSEQNLGKELYFDENLSLNRNQSCASCHAPEAGFADPNTTKPVSQGSINNLSGTRNAPSAAYAAFNPVFHWDNAKEAYKGGQFWDGRANTLADQAAGPPLNPVEMAMPNKWAIVSRIKENRSYRSIFKKVYGINLSLIPTYNPYIPSFTPPGVLEVYDRMAKAIAEFEKTTVLNAFSSKYDYYLAGKTQLTDQEKHGLDLFATKGQCAQCHINTPSTGVNGSLFPPLFTDFTYENLGLPPNVNIPTIPGSIDLGLGGRPDIQTHDSFGLQKGKFKVVTLRNCEKTAPFGHNGVFKNLEQIVHFYNTRDTLGSVIDNNDPEFGVTGWPMPEVKENVNTLELGNLQLSVVEEQAIVAFLKTLTDGYGESNGLSPLPPVAFPPIP